MTIRILCPLLVVALGSLASACDDPVPPTAQGAVSYKVQSQPDGAPSCPEGAPARVTVGGVTPNTNAPVSDGTSEDNQAVAVQCRVHKEDNGTYTVEAGITKNKVVFRISASAQPIDNLQATVTLTLGDGFNRYSSPSDQPCILNVQPAADGSSTYGIEEGKIWASVSCPALAQESSTSAAKCALGVPNQEQSFVLFQNCDN